MSASGMGFGNQFQQANHLFDVSGYLPDVQAMPTTALSPTPRKTERIEVRVSADFKERVERAASIPGRSLSGFTRFALDSTAKQTLEEHHQTVLTGGRIAVVCPGFVVPGQAQQQIAGRMGRLSQGHAGGIMNLRGEALTRQHDREDFGTDFGMTGDDLTNPAE